MVSVKKQGRFEVFSRGIEEPWAIFKDGVPFKQVWTWQEVEKILGLSGDASAQPNPPGSLKAREIRAALKARGYQVNASSRSGVRGGWEAWAVHRDLPVLSTSGHASQLDVLRELLRIAIASGAIASGASSSS